MTPTAAPKNEQWSVIRFLTLENNVLGSEIHKRICAVYGVQNVITKLTVNWWVQRFKVEQMSTDDQPWSGWPFKKRTQCCMLQASTNTLIDMKNALQSMVIMSESKL